MMTTLYEPILYKLIKRGVPCFARVVNFFRDSDLDSLKLSKLKYNCLYFMAAEADVWDIYHDDVTAGILFSQVKEKVKKKPYLPQDVVLQRLAQHGIESYKEVERDRLAVLVLIKPLLD